MLAAAVHYQHALDELLPAMRALERHPDHARTFRLYRARAGSGKALSLAYWLHACCASAMDDGGAQAAAWLREDAAGAESSMALFIRTEEEDMLRFAAKRRRRASRAA